MLVLQSKIFPHRVLQATFKIIIIIIELATSGQTISNPDSIHCLILELH